MTVQPRCIEVNEDKLWTELVRNLERIQGIIGVAEFVALKFASKREVIPETPKVFYDQNSAYCGPVHSAALDIRALWVSTHSSTYISTFRTRKQRIVLFSRLQWQPQQKTEDAVNLLDTSDQLFFACG